MTTYMSSDQHLLGEIPYIPLIVSIRSISAEREDIAQVGFQKPSISEKCHLCIGIGVNFVIDVEVIFAVAVEEEPAKIGGVGDVGNLFELVWQRKIGEVS